MELHTLWLRRDPEHAESMIDISQWLNDEWVLVEWKPLVVPVDPQGALAKDELVDCFLFRKKGPGDWMTTVNP